MLNADGRGSLLELEVASELFSMLVVVFTRSARGDVGATVFNRDAPDGVYILADVQGQNYDLLSPEFAEHYLPRDEGPIADSCSSASESSVAAEESESDNGVPDDEFVGGPCDSSESSVVSASESDDELERVGRRLMSTPGSKIGSCLPRPKDITPLPRRFS